MRSIFFFIIKAIEMEQAGHFENTSPLLIIIEKKMPLVR